MFARVMVKSAMSAARKKVETEVSLPLPTSDGKKYFHQLRVSIHYLSEKTKYHFW